MRVITRIWIQGIVRKFAFFGELSHKRLEHLTAFYSILARLEKGINGAHTLARCSGCMGWPIRGVYFFREYGEDRTDTGEVCVVRAEGIEPSRPCGLRIFVPLRLSPTRQGRVRGLDYPFTIPREV